MLQELTISQLRFQQPTNRKNYSRKPFIFDRKTSKQSNRKTTEVDLSILNELVCCKTLFFQFCKRWKKNIIDVFNTSRIYEKYERDCVLDGIQNVIKFDPF